MTRALFASDLDQTLIFPARTLAPREVATTVEIYRGRGITVAAPATLSALRELAARDAFVPVTTRSVEQLMRVGPVWDLASDGWAICANGATLLHNGQPDRTWRGVVDRACADIMTVSEARAIVQREVGSPETVEWMTTLRSCDARFLYAVLDMDQAPPDLERDSNAALATRGWRAVLHGRKLYMLPVAICKGKAVEHLRERISIENLLAAGDSALDLELLRTADLGWCAQDAELVLSGRVPQDVCVVGATHISAGAVIAEAALAHVE